VKFFNQHNSKVMRFNKIHYLLFLFLSNLLFAQQNYLDSIITVLPSFSNKIKIKTVLDIPFDKAVSNTDLYKILILNTQKTAVFTNDSLSLGKLYLKEALYLHFTTKDVQATHATLKAIAIFKKLNREDLIAASYLELGWKLKNRNLKSAFRYMKNGIELLEKEKQPPTALIGGYNNFGVLYQIKKNLDSALYFHKKSLFLCRESKDSIGLPFAQTHIAEVYLKQQKFTIAQRYLDNALYIRKKRNDIYGVTDSYLYLGDLFFAKKEYQKAVFNFKKGYNLANKNKYFPLKKYATEYLHNSYDSLENTKKSLKYYRLFTQMKDSVLNKSTNTRIAELEIEYQTAKKETKIAQQKEELLANQLEIKNKSLYAVLTTFALLFLGMIFFGVYKKNQLKRKQLQKEINLKDALSQIKTQNKLQEQRLRISRDLHDNIGSQLTFIISSIDNLKYVTKDASDVLKNKLSNISSFTSDTIFQLRDTIWAMNKNEITFEDLHTRILSFIEKAKKAVPNTNFKIIDNTEKLKTISSINGMHIFRVIQEAINNAVKYAEASTILVEAKTESNQLQISVKDNGKGFDITEIDLGNGLKNMEKRMSEIGGKILVISKPNQGTEIKISCN